MILILYEYFSVSSRREDISEVKNCLNNWFAAVFLLKDWKSDKRSLQGGEVIELSDSTNALHC